MRAGDSANASRMNRLEKSDRLLTFGFAAAAVGLVILGFGGGHDRAIVALGLTAFVSSLVTVVVALRKTPGVPTTWALVGRESSVALIGVALVIAPWARPVGGAIGLVGGMGRLYFYILGRGVRGQTRRTP
jgi:hypothetical protein